jgi:hypothetical protein
MRGAFGLLGLLIVLGVIAVTVRQQLHATRLPPVSSATASGVGAHDPGLPMPVGPGASQATQQYQADMKAALQQTADQRGEPEGK